MDSTIKEIDGIKQEDCISMNGVDEEDTSAANANSKKLSEESTVKSCLDDNPSYHLDTNEPKILEEPDNNINQELNENTDDIQGLEIKQESKKEETSDISKSDNQDAGDEEEVQKRDDDIDKEEKLKHAHSSDNSEGNNFDNPMGRNRRIRQKNRYFLDFHCIDLTKGARSSRDDYDIFTSTGSRASNRRSTTDSNRAQEDSDVFENKYCRKCSKQTPHDIDGGCQACLYKKIVESSRRQKSSNCKIRSTNSRQHRENYSETLTTSNGSSKKRPYKQSGSRSNSNITDHNINNDYHTNNEVVDVCMTIKNDNNSISNTDATIENETNMNTDAIDTQSEINSYSIGNSVDTTPKLDMWTPDEVAEYIMSKGFAQEAELFKTQLVDGISLLLMQRTDFTYGLKMKLGPALKIYDQVCKLKKEYFRNIATSTPTI